MVLFCIKYIPFVPVLFVLPPAVFLVGIEPDGTPNQFIDRYQVPVVPGCYVASHDVSHLGSEELGVRPNLYGYPESRTSLMTPLDVAARRPLYLNPLTSSVTVIHYDVMGKVITYGDVGLELPPQGFGNEDVFVESPY